MAKNTNLNLRSINIYQVFLRQHTEEGTFLSLIDDLERIKHLGMDYIYLLPVHPIGEEKRKGSIGSPYSIKDYRSLNEDYGSFEDFEKLINEAHKRGLKVMMDVVFNHTSHDAVLLDTHPEWYYREGGKLKGKVGDWWDITDLDFSFPELWDYLIDTLLMYVRLGVDGFRCDVASMIPVDFWVHLRRAARNINPNVIFLAESIHIEHVKHTRDKGFYAASDSELYEAFDILYDYDIHHHFMNYLNKEGSLNDWLKAINAQESVYPENYVKLRNLENHDQPRIAELVNDEMKLLNITALQFFLKGATMIYAGQEYGVRKKPDLFEVDKIDLTPKHMDVRNLIHRMSHLKKDSLFQTGTFKIHLQDIEVAVLSYENETSITYGIFNLGKVSGEVSIELYDGVYQNILYPNQAKVTDHKVNVTEKPLVIFALKKNI